jgi:hypothetical protein
MLENKFLLCLNPITWLLYLVGGDYFPVYVVIDFFHM